MQNEFVHNQGQGPKAKFWMPSELRKERKEMLVKERMHNF